MIVYKKENKGKPCESMGRKTIGPSSKLEMAARCRRIVSIQTSTIYVEVFYIFKRRLQ